jgi:hypothetical protein
MFKDEWGRVGKGKLKIKKIKIRNLFKKNYNFFRNSRKNRS